MKGGYSIALMLMGLRNMTADRQRYSFSRPSPKPYGNKTSRYMPHMGAKELAKAAHRMGPPA